MPAFVSPPRTVLGAHKVTTDEISDDIRTNHPDHPRLGAFLRVVNNCGVRTRYFTRPLNSPTVGGTADVHARTQATFDDAVDMSERAATAALDAAGIDARAIDAIVTTHATGYAVPNLDVHLIGRLGLRPTTRRVALTTVACAGGSTPSSGPRTWSPCVRRRRCSSSPRRCSPPPTTTPLPPSRR